MSTRILIVEDESLVAMLLEDCLVELGYQVVATAANVDAALKLVDAGDMDLAVLDVNLAGTLSFPVAEALEARGVPYIFVTGYAASGLPEQYRHRYGVQKPFRVRDLQQALAQTQLNGAASAG